MHNHPKILLIFLFFNIFVSCEQNESSQVRNVKSKTKEERLLEKQERDKARQQMFAERKVKYKNMLSENRESGDIRGIWYMEGADIKNMRNFLNADIKYSDGYCIQVSDDMKNGKVFFLYTDKVFDIKFEKVADTKYVMIYMNKKRMLGAIITIGIFSSIKAIGPCFISAAG